MLLFAQHIGLGQILLGNKFGQCRSRVKISLNSARPSAVLNFQPGHKLWPSKAYSHISGSVSQHKCAILIVGIPRQPRRHQHTNAKQCIIGVSFPPSCFLLKDLVNRMCFSKHPYCETFSLKLNLRARQIEFNPIYARI